MAIRSDRSDLVRRSCAALADEGKINLTKTSLQGCMGDCRGSISRAADRLLAGGLSASSARSLL
jgi:hypothetical protein